MYEHIPDLLDNLWTAMRDPKVAIREVAAGALSGCLKIAFERDGSLRSEWYGMVYEQAAKGFRSNSLEAIHGSLLGYQELFLRAGMVGRVALIVFTANVCAPPTVHGQLQSFRVPCILTMHCSTPDTKKSATKSYPTEIIATV